MNTRQPIQASTVPSVLSVSYSVSRKRFIIGLGDGVRVFRTDNCLTTRQPAFPFASGTAIAEALDDRYIAYVYNYKTSNGGPNIVIFWDLVLELELSRLDFHEPVLGVRMSSTWMAVILEKRTVLFQYQEIQRSALPTPAPDSDDSEDETQSSKQSLRAPNLVHSMYTTAANPYALASLSNSMLVLPAKSLGQVQLITLKSHTSSPKRVLPAHNSSLRCLALSEDESLLATASEQGTLIRVYDTKALSQVAEYRRGMDQAIVYCLGFSPGNRWVASTSDKGTLHVFDLRPPPPAEVAAVMREREQRERTHRKPQPNAVHRLSGTSFDRDSVSGVSAVSYPPSPSTAIGGGAGTADHGSIQEYYGLRPPPLPASPPTRDAAAFGLDAFKSSGLAPRIFKDRRSVASIPFYTGNDTSHPQGGTAYSWTTNPNGTRIRVKNAVLPLPNNPSGRPPKGIFAFASGDERKDDDGAVIFVVGGGSDARWEKFELFPTAATEDSVPIGWKLANRGFRKYLTRQFAD